MAAALLVVYTLYQDGKIRDEIYTEPLKLMPDNIRELSAEMLKAAAEGQNLTPEQVEMIQLQIAQMMSEGAVAQRNFEMQKTREAISKLGLFLSEFMKAKGMTYEQLQVKYQEVFDRNEIAGHQAVIESASRSNPQLLDKFRMALLKKFGLFQKSKL